MRTVNRTHTILRNILSNWTGYAVQIGVTFFLTPFVLHHLGDMRYGVWVIITSVTGYYGLLALGFQGGVNLYLTRYLATRDFENMNMVASTAVVTLSCIGMLVTAVSIAIAWLSSAIFNIPTGMVDEAFWCVIISGISIAFQLSLFPFSATFMSTQRYDIANLIGVLTRLLSAGLVYGALKLGYGLIGVSVAVAGSNIVDYCVRWRIAYRLIPELELSLKLSNMNTFREIFSFGTWTFMISIAHSIFYYMDSIIIAALMPVAALTPYALAAGVVRQLEGLLNQIEMVFYPAVTQLHAQNELDTLRLVYLKGSRFLLVTVSISAVITGFWAEDFYRLWLGKNYVIGSEYPSVALLFQILLVAMIARFLPGISSQVLLGSVRVKPLAILVFAEAMSNAFLSIVLIRNYGLVGVAWATLVSTLVFHSFILPIIVGWQLDVALRDYIRLVALKPIVVALALSLAVSWIRQLGHPKSFTELIAQGALALLVAAPLALFVGLTGEDRTHFVYKPINATWHWIAAKILSKPTLP